MGREPARSPANAEQSRASVDVSSNAPDSRRSEERTLKARAPKEAQDALVADLATLGLRIEAGNKRMNRRGHDLRRTFISIAQADGARKDIIEWGTHGPRQDIMTAHTTVPWPTLCEEWSKLEISVPEGSLISFAHFNPSAETVRARKRWQKMVTPKGLEPLFSA